MMNKIKGGIAAPSGFKAAGIASGIKKRGLDLALVFSERPAVCAGFFTTNKVKAASVIVTKSRIKGLTHKAVIINSGCANCLTGKKGIEDAKIIIKKTAGLLGIPGKEVLICSTGVIGRRLDTEKITAGIPELIGRLSYKGSRIAAKSIMTTDTHPKEVSCYFKTKKGIVKIGGIAKGAGMISPALATMLCVITTDAEIKKWHLKSAAKEAINSSFNCISVDGNMSTNDTILCFANGASGVKIKPDTKEFNAFSNALGFVCLSLAKMIVKDGEGATKFVEIEVTGAKTQAQAKAVAYGVSNSSLVKTMFYGCDPNIGRIAAACGASDKDVNQNKLDIYFDGKRVIENSVAKDITGLRDIFKKKNLNISINLKSGKRSFTVYTTDLSTEYVKINARYR